LALLPLCPQCPFQWHPLWGVVALMDFTVERRPTLAEVVIPHRVLAVMQLVAWLLLSTWLLIVPVFLQFVLLFFYSYYCSDHWQFISFCCRTRHSIVLLFSCS
jgi:hypothetical protein